jgi:two-component system, NarL family, invasion response regulator UvrY
MGITKTNGLIRIAFAEDDLSILQLASKHIDTLENCKVVIKAAEGQELLDKLRENSDVDIVILDIVMDGLDGYSTATILQKDFPEIKILFYSMCKTELALMRMLTCGGHGLIRKGNGVDHFKKAIKAVLNDKYYFPDGNESPDISNNGHTDDKLKKPLQLSATELDFIQYAITELTYKQIADAMDKQPRQVDYIREGLFKKFEVQSRIGLAAMALQSGIRPKTVDC